MAESGGTLASTLLAKGSDLVIDIATIPKCTIAEAFKPLDPFFPFEPPPPRGTTRWTSVGYSHRCWNTAVKVNKSNATFAAHL